VHLRGKVLVVEDEPPIRELAQMILEDAGYQVITAASGLEAIEKAQEELPNLVLLDVVMPGISGFEACRVLKAQPKTSAIPVVMFTVLGRENDRKLAEESGCDGYLLKPFAPEDLLKEVEKYLKK